MSNTPGYNILHYLISQIGSWQLAANKEENEVAPRAVGRRGFVWDAGRNRESLGLALKRFSDRLVPIGVEQIGKVSTSGWAAAVCAIAIGMFNNGLDPEARFWHPRLSGALARHQ